MKKVVILGIILASSCGLSPSLWGALSSDEGASAGARSRPPKEFATRFQEIDARTYAFFESASPNPYTDPLSAQGIKKCDELDQELSAFVEDLRRVQPATIDTLGWSFSSLVSLCRVNRHKSQLLLGKQEPTTIDAIDKAVGVFRSFLDHPDLLMVAGDSLSGIYVYCVEAFCNKALYFIGLSDKNDMVEKSLAEARQAKIELGTYLSKTSRNPANAKQRTDDATSYIEEALNQQSRKHIENKRDLLLKSYDESTKRDKHRDYGFSKNVEEIENMIAARSKVDPSHLEEIYANYMETVGGTLQRFSDDMLIYITSFIVAREFDAADLRADILLHMSASDPALYARARFYAGAIALINNNLEKFVILRTELQVEARAKAQAEKAAEEASAQAEIARKTAEKEAKRLARKARAAERKGQQAADSNPPTPPSREVSPVLDSSTKPTAQEEKLAKEQRHKEAEAARLVDTTGAAVAPEAETRPHPKTAWQEREALFKQIGAADQTPLQALYSLKGRPLAVLEEIQSGTYQFTRPEFTLLLEALHCTDSRTNGSHQTVEFPEMTCFMHDGHLVMVVPEATDRREAPASAAAAAPTQTFGGSTVLPPWKNKDVPLYLRPQIQGALEKLRVFGILARDAQARAG